MLPASTSLTGFCARSKRVCACLQGAAFDMPQQSAEALLERADELTSRKFTLDRPTSLPMLDDRRSVAI